MSNDNSNEARPSVKELGGLKAECFLDRIILTWNTPEGKDDAFCQVYLKDNSDPDSFWDVQDVNTPGTHTLDGLEPETDYLVFVRAFDNAGPIFTFPDNDEYLALKTTLSVEEVVDETAGSESDETDKPEPVKDPWPVDMSKALKVSDITCDGFKIKWDKMPDKDILYQVFLKESTASDDSWKSILNRKNVGSTTAKDLKDDLEYTFYVEASDDKGNTFRYDEGKARTQKAPVKEEPVVQEPVIEKPGTVTLKVTTATAHTLGFSWEKIEGKDVRYNAYMKEAKDEKWNQVVNRCTNMGGFSDCGLKSDTRYDFYYEAVDGTGKVLRREECTARTSDKVLKVTDITSDGFTIEWEPLDMEKHPETTYGVYLGGEGPGTAWCKQFKGISSYTYTGLKQGVDYFTLVYVYGPDGEEIFNYEPDGNVRILPAETTPARVNRLAVSIRQGATVLAGTDCICLELQYSYVQYDADGNVTERQSGNWKRKWKNKEPVTTVIELPEGWYFENNQVYIYIDSRKAASVGLNKWKKCSDGYVDISSGSLILELSGSYYSHNVQFKKV